MREIKHTVYLLGDSTCADKTPEAYPETGWGTCFKDHIIEGWDLKNLAVNGMSSKRFLERGLFDELLKELREGDYVLIQFGHNESKEDDRKTEPWTTFSDNLKFMITKIREKKAKPVLVSSIERRRHPIENTHGEYPQAMEAVAKEKNIPFIDMTTPTRELYEKLGPEPSKRLFNHFKKEDNSHFSPEGAALMAKMVAERMKNAPFLKTLK
ncbi:MAG: rhamnogalacturonan acetylesterase [Sphaerochaetaceae bacterium]|nr:rhamnogalacturonan acetylesterase [Sphaerochaetaceae bacterium]